MAADEAPSRDPASPGLPVAVVEYAAARAGLEPGDCIVRLNGAAPVDVLDLELAAADDVMWLTVLRDGHPLDLAIEPREGEWHGISLGHDGLGDDADGLPQRLSFLLRRSGAAWLARRPLGQG